VLTGFRSHSVLAVIVINVNTIIYINDHVPLTVRGTGNVETVFSTSLPSDSYSLVRGLPQAYSGGL
jgi:hypothetical protein